MNKKISALIIIVVVASAAGYFIYRQQKNKVSESTAVSGKTDTSSNNQVEQILSSPDDIGYLTPTADGKAQIYTNNNLGIQMVVPKNWNLGQITDKNSIHFADPTEQGPQEPLVINFYKDFKTWVNDPNTHVPVDCTTIKQCVQNDTDNTVSEENVNGSTAIRAVSLAGDLPIGGLYIEHNGIFDFKSADVVVNRLDVIGTVKFTK